MDKLTQELLNAYQRDFPITSEPYADMANDLGYQESEIIEKIQEIKLQGIVTRIGPVFDHRQAGASLLAAIKVPPPQLERVAEQINEYSEVNHNYGREHDYNLWFVVTAPSKVYLEQVLIDMECKTGFPILRLPMEQAYHIDLGFHLWSKGTLKSNFSCHADSSKYLDKKNHNPKDGALVKDKAQKISASEVVLSHSSQPISADKQKQLRAMIQDGLPIVSKPFELLAKTLNVCEDRIISTFNYWLEVGLIKRIGLITNHHRIGFTSNAMVVWDIPDNQVDGIGEAFKSTGLVSLCYKRKRHLPEWGYNLYCMIHSRDRATVERHVSELVQQCGLQDIKKEMLFSNCQFKQKGGQYTLSSTASNQAFIRRSEDSHGSKIDVQDFKRDVQDFKRDVQGFKRIGGL